MSDKNSEQNNGQDNIPDTETEFHYPAGKFDEELVEAPHGGWASDDFNEEEFDFEFDDSEFGEADYGDSYGEDSDEEGFAGEDLSEEEWAEIERAFGVGSSHTEESLCTVAIAPPERGQVFFG